MEWGLLLKLKSGAWTFFLEGGKDFLECEMGEKDFFLFLRREVHTFATKKFRKPQPRSSPIFTILFRMGSPIELCISYQFMVGKPHRRADFCHVMVGSLIKGPILPHTVG